MPSWKRLLTAAALATGVVAAAASTSAASEVVYNNIPNTLPGNFVSVGAEAYSYAEVGTQLELGGSKRNKPQVEVVMSAWACQYGTWYQATCETPQPKKKFKWPLTVKFYEVGENNAVGEYLGETSKTFSMPYRPSDDTVHCTEGRWYDAASATCFHGYAFKVKFPPVKVLRLPKRVIIGISYNTSDHGPAPVGSANACNTKSAGCYYDSLNVGLEEAGENLLTAGKNPTEPYINLQSEAAVEAFGCGNNALLGKFGMDACPAFWEGSQPLLRISAH
jgi:hypothetical protein